MHVLIIRLSKFRLNYVTVKKQTVKKITVDAIPRLSITFAKSHHTNYIYLVLAMISLRESNFHAYSYRAQWLAEAHDRNRSQQF